MQIKCSAYDIYADREIDLTPLKSTSNYEAQIDEQLKSKELKDIKVSETPKWSFFPFSHYYYYYYCTFLPFIPIPYETLTIAQSLRSININFNVFIHFIRSII